MKHHKRDVWTNETGTSTLLEKHGPDTFYLPNSWPNLERLREVHEAIGDALRREAVLARVNGPIAENVSSAENVCGEMFLTQATAPTQGNGTA